MNTRSNDLATTVNTISLGATKKGDVDTVDTSANKSHSARAGKTLRNGCQHRQHCQRRASFRRRRKRGGLGFNYTEAMLLIDPRSQRRPSKGVTGSPPILPAIWVNKQKAVATQNSAECVELAILALAFSEAYQRV